MSGNAIEVYDASGLHCRIKAPVYADAAWETTMSGRVRQALTLDNRAIWTGTR